MESRHNNYFVTIDDDQLVSRIIEVALNLKSLSLVTSEAFYAQDFSHPPLGIFVDIHLGLEDNGIDLITPIRARWDYVPILVMTSDADNTLIGQALAAGANDFVRKPLDASELAARFKARSSELRERQSSDNIQFHDLLLNLRFNKVSGPTEGSSTYLSQRDTHLLYYLMQSGGTLVTRQELKRKVWGDLTVTDNALDKRLYEIRSALKNIHSNVKLQSNYRKGFGLVYGDAAELADLNHQ